MAEHYRFFDSTADDERVYTADEFAEYFRRVLTDGIFNGGTNLKVETNGTDIRTYIQPGYAWVQGYMYKIDTEPLYLQHEYPDPSLDRIDRVVIRLDKRLEHRYVRAFILKGTPAASPVPPLLTRDENVFELSLAQVRIIKGKSYIEGSQITDERLNNSVCGLVNSLIQADTTTIFNQFQHWYNSRTTAYQKEWGDWFATAVTRFEQEWRDWLSNLGAKTPVISVNGKSGSVTLGAADVGATPASHAGSGGNAHPLATTTTAGFMSGPDKKRLDEHIGAGGTAHTLATITTAGFMSGSDKKKLDEHIGDGGTAHPLVTTTVAGFMSSEDKDMLQSLRKYRSGYDSVPKIYTVVEYKRKDGTLFMKSVLSSKVGSNYTVDTQTYFALNGTTVRKTEIYDITYDSDGSPVNEVLR